MYEVIGDKYMYLTYYAHLFRIRRSDCYFGVAWGNESVGLQAGATWTTINIFLNTAVTE
jgi:hypothetical protein